jgi:hypothetical protein
MGWSNLTKRREGMDWSNLTKGREAMDWSNLLRVGRAWTGVIWLRVETRGGL